ncbi:MAG: hypothetical protein U1E59_20555 [Amaricoccus sp.]
MRGLSGAMLALFLLSLAACSGNSSPGGEDAQPPGPMGIEGSY